MAVEPVRLQFEFLAQPPAGGDRLQRQRDERRGRQRRAVADVMVVPAVRGRRGHPPGLSGGRRSSGGRRGDETGKQRKKGRADWHGSRGFSGASTRRRAPKSGANRSPAETNAPSAR